MIDRHALVRAVSLVLALVAVAPPGHAQEAVRRELLVQAQGAQSRGDHARALDFAQRAAQLEVTPSLQMFIAQEEQALGQLAEALDAAERCQRTTERDTAARNRDEILRVCRELVSSLQPRVGRITVSVPASAPAGLRVTVAGRELVAALYNVPYIVTPGSVVVEASALGRMPLHRALTVTAGERATVEIVLPVAPVVTEARVPDARVAPVPAGGVPAGAIAALAVGGVALATGGVFAALRAGAVSAFESTYCSGPTYDHCMNIDAARTALVPVNTYTVLTDVALGVGAVAVVGGAVWLLVGLRGGAHEAPRVAGVQWTASPLAHGGAMFTVGGAL